MHSLTSRFETRVVALGRCARILFSTRLALPALLLLATSAAAQTLSLDEAVRLAETGQPLLDGQRAGIEASRQGAVAAAQLPDPKLKLGVLNLPVTGDDAFSLTQDFMTMRMVGVMQEFPRAEKRRLRGELIQLGSEQKALELDFMRRMIRRDASVAWLDAWFAERAAETVRTLQRETETQVETLVIGLRAGRTGASDVAAARVELELLGDREAEFARQSAVARADLARWIGEAAGRPLPQDMPALPEPPSAAQLVAHVERHPHLNAFAKQAQIAETDARLAQQAARPDWNVELSYAQRGSAYSNMVSIQFGVDLPLFKSNRQDRVVLSKLADAERVRAQRDDNLRQMRADLQRLAAERDAAMARAARFRERILPQAQARLEATIAGYRSGKGTLAEVLEARRALLDLQIERLARETRAVRAGLELDYFVVMEVGR
jgi:outer membrane protein TolC